MAIRRANVYIDGFNLYYGLRAAGRKDLLWLDLRALCASLIRRTESLGHIIYFTAIPDTGDAGRRERHLLYLRVLESCCPGVEIRLGKFLDRHRECPVCGARYTQPEEKRTDVNIASALVSDAYEGSFEVAYLLSADSDLIPALLAVKRAFPEKKVRAWFPPCRGSFDLRDASDGAFRLRPEHFEGCLFPDTMQLPEGKALFRPPGWIRESGPPCQNDESA